MTDGDSRFYSLPSNVPSLWSRELRKPWKTPIVISSKVYWMTLREPFSLPEPELPKDIWVKSFLSYVWASRFCDLAATLRPRGRHTSMTPGSGSSHSQEICNGALLYLFFLFLFFSIFCPLVTKNFPVNERISVTAALTLCGSAHWLRRCECFVVLAV